MSIWLLLPILFFAALPALIYLGNRRHFRPPPIPTVPLPPVSILIPARNESRSIAAAIEAVQASQSVDWELIILDDHSEDDTAAIVQRYAAVDSRIRLATAPPLPTGWCGKQHACFALSKLATRDVFVFLDADVRVSPDGIARMLGFLESTGAPLVSGFPRQETGTILEKLLIPLIHFMLLGFLPIARMRQTPMPGMGAGCGQLFVARRKEYEVVGGHEAVKTSLHDGIKLPRAYRKAGFMTDVCDATPVAVCRMYRSAGETWRGLAKNAREGLGAPAILPFFTLLLTVGQILPLVYLIVAAVNEVDDPLTWAILGTATIVVFYPRLDAAIRFRQSWIGAMLHPLGIGLLLMIQWYANFRAWLGRPSGWKGRAYPAEAK